MKITPLVSTPAIIVEPSSIVFSGYSETIKIFKMKASNALEGEFQLKFTKEEQSETFYNDIPSQTIAVSLSERNYTITFSSINAQSVGLPIELAIMLEIENSREFTLLYSHNCTQDYVFNPSSFLNIPSGTAETSIAFTYTGNTIPQMCVLDVEISSLTVNRYYLPVKRLYISASKSIDRAGNSATMRIKVGPEFSESEDVGYVVLNTPIEEVAPDFYSLNETDVYANSANFICSVSNNGTVYFAVFKIGTNRNKVTHDEIYFQNSETAITYGSSRTYVSNTISTVQANLTAHGLTSQTSYMMGAYLNSTTGISDIMFEVFHTDKSSNGAAIKISFSSIYT